MMRSYEPIFKSSLRKRDQVDMEIMEMFQSQKEEIDLSNTKAYSSKYKATFSPAIACSFDFQLKELVIFQKVVKLKHPQFSKILDQIKERQENRKYKKRFKEEENVNDDGASRSARMDVTYVDLFRSLAAEEKRDLLTDFKQSMKLMKKKGSMIQKGGDNVEDWENYVVEGIANLKRNQYHPALGNFTKAIKQDSQNAQAFINRSSCYLKLGKADMALADSTEAIKILGRKRIEIKNPDKSVRCRFVMMEVKALKCQADALYILSRFEQALIYYKRCVALRPDLNGEFKSGISNATNAILNSVGENCFKSPFLNLAINEAINDNPELKALKKCTMKLQAVSAMTDHHTQVHVRQIGSWSNGEDTATTSSRPLILSHGIGRCKIAFRSCDDYALGRLCTDHGFFQDFIEEFKPKVLLSDASEALTFLEQRREFWKNQDPQNHKKKKAMKELRI